MSRAWMSEDQRRFINDYVQKLQDAKANGIVAAFYDQFYADWFTKFPELGIAFPNAKTIDDLSKDDKEELEWCVKNKKAVSFDVNTKEFTNLHCSET
jgi:hypothetical protein